MAKKEAAASPPNHRMFVVDDEPGICRVLSQLFTREGWNVLTFSNPAEALKRVQPSMIEDEAGMLGAFDSHRARIRAAAAKLYSKERKGSYELGAADL